MTPEEIRQFIIDNVQSIVVERTPDGIMIGFNSDEIEIALQVHDLRNVD